MESDFDSNEMDSSTNLACIYPVIQAKILLAH